VVIDLRLCIYLCTVLSVSSALCLLAALVQTSSLLLTSRAACCVLYVLDRQVPTKTCVSSDCCVLLHQWHVFQSANLLYVSATYNEYNLLPCDINQLDRLSLFFFLAAAAGCGCCRTLGSLLPSCSSRALQGRI
jgi:hypothetical protein